MINFVVDIKPIGKGRPRVVRKGWTYTPKTTIEYEKLLQWEFKKQFPNYIPSNKPLRMSVIALFKPSKSWSKKKQKEHIAKYKTTKPDLDNIIKAIKDSLNGFAYIDDSQVVEYGICYKKFDIQNKLIIKIEEI